MRSNHRPTLCQHTASSRVFRRNRAAETEKASSGIALAAQLLRSEQAAETQHTVPVTLQYSHCGLNFEKNRLHAIWSYKKRWDFPTSLVFYFLTLFIQFSFLNLVILYSHCFLFFHTFAV